MQTVRRYANRKFYHLEGHCYLNLEGIAALVRAGEEVVIVEHPGGRDITPAILAQVIAQDEEAAGRSTLLAALIRGGRFPLEEAGRLLLTSLGLPTRGDWQRLEREVERLEGLLARLAPVDEGPRPPGSDRAAGAESSDADA